MRLSGKVALVTGGAKGIGRAIAERYLAEGASVMIADTDGAAGEKAVDDLAGGGTIAFMATDISDKAEVERVVASCEARFSKIDILVNNAGIVHKADFLDLDEADFDRVLRVNLKGAFLCGQAVARHMVHVVKRGGNAGTIINMSSVNAVFALPDQVGYSVSKGGVNQLTKTMALSLAPYGIRVNAIGPGSIMTDLLAAVASDKGAEKRILSRTPLGRIGDPSEIASVATFLASNDASYVTGQTIYADGGRLGLNYTMPVKE